MLYSWIKEKALQHRKSYVEDGVIRWSFEDLFLMAEKMASTLKNEKYGILFENEIFSTVAILACLCAHKPFVMLSANYGAHHTESILKTMNISALIRDKRIEHLPTNYVEKEDLSDVAMILCTSGSTGIPKGVMLTGNNIRNNLLDFTEACCIESNNKLIITRPMFHCSVIICEFLFSLINGINIVFCNTRFNPFAISKAIGELGVTVIGGTPSTLYHISKIISKTCNTDSIKYVICSGECLTQTVADALKDNFPRSKIFHAYGMTEAGPRISCLPPALFDSHYDFVGYPMKSTEIRLEKGELLIAGTSLFKGYYGKGPRTEKWFHTGDAASIENGLIKIHGRIDDMIIRRGINIYPAQIENIVKQHEKICDACAVGVHDKSVTQKIHLYIEGNELSDEEAYKICVKLLPPYLLPDRIEVVPELERTPTGKLRRKSYGMS